MAGRALEVGSRKSEVGSPPCADAWYDPQSEIRSPKSEIVVGVLALQGGVEKHIRMLERCEVRAIPVRLTEELDAVHGLVIPGGESTTVGKLMARYGLDRDIIKRAKKGMPVFGTCAGMILLAENIVGSEQHRLGLMASTVLRNAFGRQVDSFEADLDISAIGPPAFRAVFIRAPYAVQVNGNIEILALYKGKGVLLKQGNLLASAFHPELTDDSRIHQYFVGLVRQSLSTQSSKPERSA
ncbi:MAG TPA: pyridoxal 5'-phosphate synthase glutaminase subunit PdxT [Armatimonadota bacterium]|nr:pyridoxal 5'-phosphate synthase glutaminase subunit PdxT [Armatimonadota bacterium]